MVIAIPTLLAGEALGECLDALRRQTFRDFKVVVVDNSGKGLVRRSGDPEQQGALVLEMPSNVGFGAAINRAWQLFDSALLATLNDDAIAAPTWLAALVSAADRYPAAGMFASRVTLAGADTIDSAGMLLCADGSSKQRGHGKPPCLFDAPEEALLPSGSAALYRAAMLRDAGVFDPYFFLYCEDTDLGLRGQRAGWCCRYVPEANVTHRYSHSAGRVSAGKAYFVERNRLFVAVKNFPLSMLIAVPFAAAARYVWHILFLLRGKGAAAQFAIENEAWWQLPWFVLKAHFALLVHLPRLIGERRTIRKSAKLGARSFHQMFRRYSITSRQLAEY